MTIPWAWIPALAGAVTLALWYGVGIFMYAHRLRLRLKAAEDLEERLRHLGRVLEDGNQRLLNVAASDEAVWRQEFMQWMTGVEDYLELHFGLWEMYEFELIVLLANQLPPSGGSAGHDKDRNILAHKLMTIKAIIRAYSERAWRWRMEKTTDDLPDNTECDRHGLAPARPMWPKAL